jgi:hypothetical protein
MRTPIGFFLLFSVGCIPKLEPGKAIAALTSVDKVEPSVDDKSANAQSSFDNVNLSLSGVGFKGEISGDGEVWDGNVKVKGFLPFDFDESISAEVSAKYRDIEVLESGIVLDGHLDLETGIDYSDSEDVFAWLDLVGSMKADDGETIGTMDFEIYVDVADQAFEVEVIVNDQDVTEEFLDGEFTSFMVFHPS